MIPLLLAALLGQGASPPPLLRTPDIHGEKVAFTCEGDLWVGDRMTGKAVRLTRDEGVESNPRFSPDGKQIAFSAGYDGRQEVYVLPTEGGVPRRLTFRQTNALMLDWTPDGKQIVFRSSEYPSQALFQVPVAGGYPQRLPFEFASHFAFAPDGNRCVFTRFPRANAPWFRYEGGWKNDIWVGDLAKKTFRRVVETKGTHEFPAWIGERIAFIRDEEGQFSVFTSRPDGSGQKRVAGPYPEEIRFLHSDGTRLIYQKGLSLEVCDPAINRVTPLQFDLASDRMHALPSLSPAGRNVFGASIGPSGKRVLVETRGQILSVPVKEGDARLVLAKEGVRYRYAALSPDAKRLAYVSDETREQQLFVANADGSAPKPLTSDKNRQLIGLAWSPDSKWIALTDSETRLRLINAQTGQETEIGRGSGWNGPSFDFSPDSKWLAYTQTDYITYFGSLVLYEIATGKRIPIGDGRADDFTPAFSPDGKWLAFLSRRNIAAKWDAFLNQIGTENPVKVFLLSLQADTRSPFLPDDDEEGQPEKKEEKAETPPRTVIEAEGLAERLIEIPVTPAGYIQLGFAGSRLLMTSTRPESSNLLTYYDLKEKKGGTLTEGFQSFQVSADGKKILLVSGANSRVVDATGQSLSTTEGKLNFADVPLRIVPTAEWENMYWDAWRLIRDYFYVANLHGVDWPAIGAKYARLLPSLRSRDELNDLIRFLLAELTVSHAGVFGGDNRSLAGYAPQPGFLGIDVEPDSTGYYQITRVLRGDGFKAEESSPLAAPGLNVKEGDYLLEVAGSPVKAGTGFLQSLVGRVGQVVALKVNRRPTLEGARTIHVKPIANEGRMRYLEWVKGRREYVRKASQGKLAYIHLAAMGDNDMEDFIKQYFPQRNRDGLLMDVRFNNGGNISNNIVTVLKQRVAAYFNQRALPQPWTRQTEFFLGPMVCLLNEFSASNGEEFPHHFKTLGLGSLVGRRTWGGEVGSDPGWPLADGGVVLVPNYGAWTPKDGWIIEGRGVSPDYDVESDPNAYAQGRDPQLDKAIQLLLAELERNPVKRPTQPPDPIRVRRR